MAKDLEPAAGERDSVRCGGCPGTEALGDGRAQLRHLARAASAASGRAPSLRAAR
jgi:hypothetical protein